MTIKDIARKANVSVATVSRVINEYKWVSPEVRARVQKVIEEENYRPNYSASVMATGKSNMIAIIVPNFMSPFFAQFTGIVSARLKTAGYTPVLFQTDNNSAEEAAYFASPMFRIADGVINVTDALNNKLLLKLIRPLREKNKPILFLDRYLPATVADCVINDNVGGMYSAVELLWRNGHRRIGMITGTTGMTVVSDKLRGFRSAMKELELPVCEEYLRSGNWTVETGRAEMERLLSMPEPPTAVIACNNYICEGALEALDAAGLEVGKTFSLIGMEESDSDARLFRRLGITTLKLDCTRLAEYACNYILSHLDNTEEPYYYTTTEFRMELIVRDSVVNLRTKPQ